jgi:hypothetical protein
LNYACGGVTEDFSPAFNALTLEEVILGLPLGKATGCDGLTYDALKAVGGEFFEWLSDALRRRVTEALDTEVRKLAEAETNYNVVAANKGDSFKVQDPANLPEQPDSPTPLAPSALSLVGTRW